MSMIKAPNDIEQICLEELFEKYVRKNLIKPEIVTEFHKELIGYLESQNAVYLIRQLKSLERGKIIKNRLGYRIKPTDNSPGWWIHYQLFNDNFSNINQFMGSIPCHMFKIGLKASISSNGWHVAHILGSLL